MRKPCGSLDRDAIAVYWTAQLEPAVFPIPLSFPVLNAFTETALRILVEFLKHEGLDARFTDKGARLGIEEALVDIETLHDEESEHPDLPGELIRTVSLRYSVRMTPDSPPAFGNPINGLGETLKDALAMAASIWVEGDLPTIRPLIGGQVGPGTQVVAEGHDWRIPPWVVFLGAYQFGGPSVEPLTDFVREHPPFLALRSLIDHDLERDAIHWITISGFRAEPGPAFGRLDCWLDGEPWSNGADALQDVDWPELQTPRFIRQFLALVPESAIEQVPGTAE